MCWRSHIITWQVSNTPCYLSFEMPTHGWHMWTYVKLVSWVRVTFIIENVCLIISHSWLSLRSFVLALELLSSKWFWVQSYTMKRNKFGQILGREKSQNAQVQIPALPIWMTSGCGDRSTFIIGIALGLSPPDSLFLVTQGEDHMVSMPNHIDCWWLHAVLYEMYTDDFVIWDPGGPTAW